MIDEATKKTLTDIPTLKTKAGPRDSDLWFQRLKEEYQALITVSYFLISLFKTMFMYRNFLRNKINFQN